MVSLPGTMISPLTSLRDRYDAILFDLDGTLLDPASRVTLRTYRAVQALLASGMEVMICTGRSVAGTTSIHRGLGLKTPVAAYNGSWIGWPGRRPWRFLTIPESLLASIESAEEVASFSFRHNGMRKFTVRRDHGMHERIAKWYENVITVTDPRALPTKDLMRVSCYFDDADCVEAGWDALGPAARDGLRVQSYPMRIFYEFQDTDLQLGEIQLHTRGKAEVFDYLASERGIPAARTIAVGDQLNDLSMLASAGLAVSVGNGVPEVQAVADLVIGPHDEDGIAAWIEAGAPTTGGDA